MKQNLKKIIQTTGVVLGISISIFFLTFVVLAWTGPQHTPPTCESGEVGCDEVLHTGASAQSKAGGLLLNTGGATNGLIVENGNVGIGTTNPTHKLEVSSSDYIDLVINQTDSGAMNMGITSGTPEGFIGMYGGGEYTGLGELKFLIEGYEKARINNDGSIGVGVENPQYGKIELNPGIASENNGIALFMGSGATARSYLKPDNGDNYNWHLTRAGVDSKGIIINKDGNVGMGITEPEKLLHVYGDDDPTIKIQSNGTNEISGKVSLRQSNLTGADIYYDGRSTAEGLSIETFDSTSSQGVNFFIKYSGNVGIGTTSPSYKLHVNGTAYASGAAGALSDIRHKKEVTELSFSGIDIIERLRPVSFLWKEPQDSGMEGTQMGFIAQEVEEVLPEAVLTMDNEEETKGLKYNSFIPVLVKAVKEQQEEINNLKTENNILKERMDLLENLFN